MCTKGDCRQARHAKKHVGEWLLTLDKDDAGNVQYVIDEAAREGIILANVGEVMLFCLLTVSRFMAARVSFTVNGMGDGR